MTKLALLGGEPVLPNGLPRYKSLSSHEEEAVKDVVRSGCLSGFYGSWEDGFLGGPKVQEFESAWSEAFGSTYTISVNSNTSGLFASIGAAGVGPGDEVIVPCTTMSATAMAPLVYGAIPVFADIDEKTFCISLESVCEKITDKTKAVLAVNLFGQAAPLAELRKICDARAIVLIEDNAQAPTGMERQRFCGTIGHIGVFSLNYHKHIHTGEGGMCCTDDERLARRLQMIRNHAEAVVEEAGVTDLVNMVGFNYRMTELQAAIGLVQLSMIDNHVERRRKLAESLSAGVNDLAGVSVPFVREDCRHVYYNWALRFDSQTMGIDRDTYVKALVAEGFPCSQGYVKPLYQLPVFRERIAIGSKGYPFNLTNRSYTPGMCPTAERLHKEELIIFEACAWEVDEALTGDLITIMRKVHEHIDELVAWKLKETA